MPATVLWDGGVTGQGTNWLDPVNWVGDVLPGPSDDAVFPSSFSTTEIIVAGNASVRSVRGAWPLRLTAGALTIGAAESMFGYQGLTLDGGILNPLDGASVTLSRIIGPGTLTIPAGVTFTLSSSELWQAPLVNNGTLVANQLISAYQGGVTNTAGATLRVVDEQPAQGGTYGGCLSVQGNLTNYGSIEISSLPLPANFFDLQVTYGRFINAGGGRITFGGAQPPDWSYKTDSINADVDNQGTITVGPGARVGWAGRNSANAGTINVVGELGVGTYGPTQTDTAMASTGTINVAAGGVCRVNNFRYRGGSITGAGRFYAGDSPGALDWGFALDSDYTVAVTNFIVGNHLLGPGTLTNPAGNTMRFENGANYGRLVNRGVVVASGGALTGYDDQNTKTAGSFVNAEGATLRIEGTVYWASDYHIPDYGVALTNQGVVEITAGSKFVSDGCRIVNVSGGNITNFGTIALDGSLTVDQTAAGATFINAGTIGVTGYRTFKVLGTFTNTGTIVGWGTVAGAFTGGTIAPNHYAPSFAQSEPIGILTVNGSVAGTALAVDLNGTTVGTQYDQLKVNGTVALGGPLVASLGYTPMGGDTFRIIDNDGSDPVAGTFTGLPEGATATVGGKAFRISYAAGDGNDVTLTSLAPPAIPKVQSVQINDGAAQRSSITSLTVTFNTGVTFAGRPADAFTLTRDVDTAPVAFTAATSVAGSATIVTLSQFLGAATEAGSLADGPFTLTVRAGQVSTAAGSLDGNGDGTSGDDYTFGAAQGLRRLYGDVTGDGMVRAADLTLFRQTFGRTVGDRLFVPYLDVNGDGAINGIDLTRFRQAYTFEPPRVTAIQINDGSAQRSRVTSLSVTFNTLVTFGGAPAAVFRLTREDGTPVTFVATLSVAGDATRVTLDHFAELAVEAGSLADGRYTLKVLANQVSTPGGALDGNADGTPGDDYSFGAAQGLVRLYGDGNGDGKVDAADLALFRQSFGRVAGDPLYLSLFDVNGDGAINGTDLTRFRQAYGAGG